MKETKRRFTLLMWVMLLWPASLGAATIFPGAGEYAHVYSPGFCYESGDCAPGLGQTRTTLLFGFASPLDASDVAQASLSLFGTMEMFVGKHFGVLLSDCAPIIGHNGFTTDLASDYEITFGGQAFALGQIYIFETHPGLGLPNEEIAHSGQTFDITNVIRQALLLSGPSSQVAVETEFLSAPCSHCQFKFTNVDLSITETPEPCSRELLFGGAVVAAAFRRYRRARG